MWCHVFGVKSFGSWMIPAKAMEKMEHLLCFMDWKRGSHDRCWRELRKQLKIHLMAWWPNFSSRHFYKPSPLQDWSCQKWMCWKYVCNHLTTLILDVSQPTWRSYRRSRFFTHCQVANYGGCLIYIYIYYVCVRVLPVFLKRKRQALVPITRVTTVISTDTSRTNFFGNEAFQTSLVHWNEVF